MLSHFVAASHWFLAATASMSAYGAVFAVGSFDAAPLSYTTQQMFASVHWS